VSSISAARVERIAECIENRRRWRARLSGFGRHQLATTAMQRGLDRACRRRQRLGDLLQGQIERVLEDDRRALLWR
jgi:hypothetical protein